MEEDAFSQRKDVSSALDSAGETGAVKICICSFGRWDECRKIDRSWDQCDWAERVLRDSMRARLVWSFQKIHSQKTLAGAQFTGWSQL